MAERVWTASSPTMTAAVCPTRHELLARPTRADPRSAFRRRVFASSRTFMHRAGAIGIPNGVADDVDDGERRYFSSGSLVRRVVQLRCDGLGVCNTKDDVVFTAPDGVTPYAAFHSYSEPRRV